MIPSSNHQPGDIIRRTGQFVTRQTYQENNLSDGLGVVVYSEENKVYVISKFLGFGTWGPSSNVYGCTLEMFIEMALSDMDGEKSSKSVTDYYGDVASFGVIRNNDSIQNVNSSEWYMPGAGELSLIKRNYSEVTSSIKSIGGDVSSSDTWGNHAWVSTQQNSTTAWCWQISQMASGNIENGLSTNLKNTNYNTPIYGFKKIYV